MSSSSQPAPRSKPSWYLLHWLCWVAAPLVSMVLSAALSGAMKVMRTGKCPGHPPDIPPRACTVLEYLTRDVLTPFAIAGLLMVAVALACCVTGAWAIIQMVQRSERWAHLTPKLVWAMHLLTALLSLGAALAMAGL